tara:strand:+ start:4302 stop:4529 length:228 start_codon:yes stop_codon:yes gene_type:complete
MDPANLLVKKIPPPMNSGDWKIKVVLSKSNIGGGANMAIEKEFKLSDGKLFGQRKRTIRKSRKSKSKTKQKRRKR